MTRPILLSGHDRHFDVLANEPPQHFVQVLHHVIEVEHDGLNRLFAAEDQQLPRQPGGALRRVADFLGVLGRALVEGYWPSDRSLAAPASRPTRAMSAPTATTAGSACASSPDREGDAMARVNVRFGELSESLRILRQAIDHLRRGETASCARRCRATAAARRSAGPRPPRASCVVWVEIRRRPRSAACTSPHRRCATGRCSTTPSPTDVLTDFAFIEHSFGLTPAGADR